MSILIVHMGTGTILDANDDVWVVDTNELTSEELEALEDAPDETLDFLLKYDVDVATKKGTNIMEVIRHYKEVSA